MEPRAMITYACRCGRWSPVGAMFFSEQCQKLVCRAPSCSVEEFESYYCGSLLVNMSSKEASLYQNRSSRCFACAACETVLSTVFDTAQAKYFFACAHCHWDSLTIGLAEEDPDTLLMTAVARERETPHEDAFHTLLSFHTTAASEAMPSSSSSSSTSLYSGSRRISSAFARSASLTAMAGTMKEMQREQRMKKFRQQRVDHMGTWKMEHAEAKEREREQWLDMQRHQHEWPNLQQQLAPIAASLHTKGEDLEAIAGNGDMQTVTTLAQRLLMPLDQPRDATQLLPHRPLLRVKRTWRCIESIARGSAGILVKPHIGPLSGDSSMQVPASWFKKANLARQFVPVVTFHSLPQVPAEGGQIECVLLIENPLDDAIQIVCQPGESLPAHAKVLLEDATPIVLGAYEDPSLADAFAGDAARDTAASTAGRSNRHLLSSTRNLAKLVVPLEIVDSEAHDVVTFRLQIEMLKLDEPDHEPVMGSLFSFLVELAAPVRME